jgi:SNF2 family DNA or RNA helicase
MSIRNRLEGRRLLPSIKPYDGNNNTPINEWGLKIELYSHQKKSVIRMEHLEKQRKREYSDENGSVSIESKFGILNDKVGSGKTLMCVSLISREVNTPSYKHIIEDKQINDTVAIQGNSIYSMIRKRNSTYTYFPVTVIAVNNSVIYQWKSELEQSNLLFKIITRNVEIDQLSTYIEHVHVLIVSKTLYNRFVNEFKILALSENRDKEYCVKRLIVDEYCRRGSFPEIKHDFCWLITATIPTVYDFCKVESRINYMNICLQSSGERTYSHMYTTYSWNNIIVKNSDEDINQSFLIARVSNIVYIARGNHNRLLDMNINVSVEVRRMIVADNIKGAITAIGGNVEKDDLLTVIIKREEEEIKRIEASITYHATLSQEDRKNEYIEKLNNTKRNLENLKEKISRDESSNECPLCYDEFDDKCLVSCCNSIICSRCTSKVIRTNNKCPFCRSLIDLNTMIVSSKKAISKSKYIKTKVDYILEIISKKPNGKFIIFSEYSDTYKVVEDMLKKSGIKYAEIKGTTSHKNSILQKYKKGELNLLFLNCRNDGAGINLPETTDIIIYHRISSNTLETQLLGRALRLGRTADLTVHRLMYKQEYDLNDDNTTVDYLFDQNDEEDEETNTERNNENERISQIESDYQMALRLQRSGV